MSTGAVVAELATVTWTGETVEPAVVVELTPIDVEFETDAVMDAEIDDAMEVEVDEAEEEGPVDDEGAKVLGCWEGVGSCELEGAGGV